jgi:GNAT superfamily N-acetyltransferase
MSVKFKFYDNTVVYGNDYDRVRNFLIELDSHNYHFGRWDWMFMSLSAEWADPEGIEKVGIWEDGHKVVAITTYDTKLGSAFLLTLKGYEILKEEMFIFAKANLTKDDLFRVLVLDGDQEMQNIVEKANFYPTQDKECDAIYPIDLDKIKYDLPKGFKITSLEENFDVYKYGQALWKGFNHEINEEGPFSFYWEKHSKEYINAWKAPNIDMNLKISVMAPNGDFVSHCGMWYDKKSKSALVEPVATEPAYRKMGLGKAAVLEGIKRCGELGAERAFVGSSQQFYYSIGFRPYATSTWWKEKPDKTGQNSI